MTLAIVSDVHGNLSALEAVVEDLQSRGVERVVHGGDLAVAGCAGPECIDLIRELGWTGVLGNTDELLWRAEGQTVPEPLLSMRLASGAQLGEERIEWLRELPAEHREDELELALVHASPGDLWRAPAPDAQDEQLLETYGPLEAAIAVYGHIHLPYVRRVENMTVVNSGSVGYPLDEDPRAGYALFADGEPEIVRVEYDVEREVHALLRSRYPDAERLAQMRRTGAFVPVG
jgi:putative phosphoesterase